MYVCQWLLLKISGVAQKRELYFDKIIKMILSSFLPFNHRQTCRFI